MSINKDNMSSTAGVLLSYIFLRCKTTYLSIHSPKLDMSHMQSNPSWDKFFSSTSAVLIPSDNGELGVLKEAYITGLQAILNNNMSNEIDILNSIETVPCMIAHLKGRAKYWKRWRHHLTENHILNKERDTVHTPIIQLCDQVLNINL